MKSVLSLDETPSALDRSVKAAVKLSRGSPADLEMESIPLKALSSLTEEIHVKTREVSQNTDLDMREFLGIDKALQNIQGELLNNTAKLKEIDKRIERDTKKLKEVEHDSTYNDEQKQLYRDRLDDWKTEKQARLEILSQNRKDLQTQVGRIKQTIEKVLDKNAPLLERIRTLFRGTRHNYIFSTDCLLFDFFPCLCSVFFTSVSLDFCSSSLGSSMAFLGSSDLDSALGCKIFLSFLLHFL